MAHFVRVDSLKTEPNARQDSEEQKGATDNLKKKKKARQIFPLEAEVLLQDNST